tara:strand:- start:1231 stop:2373 length:1143 start_codon:yes stop_codon:yes gene_type:complete
MNKIKLLVVIGLIVVSSFVALADFEKTKIDTLQKEEINQEDEQILKEYYGKLESISKNKDVKFNNIAKKNSLAILNVSIDGKDRRLLTRLNTGTIYSGSASDSYLFTTTNLIVLGNITLKGLQFTETDGFYGVRRFYSPTSTKVKIEDEGYSRLYNGVVNISINPILRNQIDSYNVYLSPEGITEGIYVSEKSNNHFTIKSVNPNSNVGFSWLLRGTKKNYGDEYLRDYSNSNYTITASIDYEGGLTSVIIKETNQVTSINSTINSTTPSITGNIVLEEDLSQILDNITLPEVNQTQDKLPQIIPTPIGENTDRTLILDTTNEDEIISRVSVSMNLTIYDISKMISFDYQKPTGGRDEIITKTKLDGIEKVNGSIIIRLG